MSWTDVGNWVKDNAGTGAALVGSLLTGNMPSAVAAGVALVSSATGSNDAQIALERLQSDPQTVVELRRLANEEKDSIRKHIQKMTELELSDKQHQHKTTQATIRSGDNAEDRLVRWTRPLQSWTSLAMAGTYVFTSGTVDIIVLSALLTLPWAYAGLRQVGKISDVWAKRKVSNVK